MIKDITVELRSLLSAELGATIEALTTLNKHFGRETQSIALGEISESLIPMRFIEDKHEVCSLPSLRSGSCVASIASM